MRFPRFTPRPDTPMAGALRALDARVRPDFRRALGCAVLAFGLDAVAHTVGGVHAHALHARLIAYGCAAGFVVLGVIATRSAAGELARVSLHRAGPSAATPLRVVSLLLGYLIVAVSGLDLFAVPVGKLLVGGAVTGVILGIAAQQSLSNVFAGLVLLFARPYVPGEAIRIRSGALGGSLDGIVTAVGLLYTSLDTADGIVNIPNAGLLAAAVGPLPGATVTTGASGATVESAATVASGPSGATGASGAPADARSQENTLSTGPGSGSVDAGAAPARVQVPDATQSLPVVDTPTPDTGRRSSQHNDRPGDPGPDRWSRPTVTGRRSRRVGTARPDTGNPDGNGNGEGDGRASGTAAAIEGGVAGAADARRSEENPTQQFARFEP